MLFTHLRYRNGGSSAKAFSQKKTPVLSVGYEMLKNGDLEDFAVPGNTGAMAGWSKLYC